MRGESIEKSTEKEPKTRPDRNLDEHLAVFKCRGMEAKANVHSQGRGPGGARRGKERSRQEEWLGQAAKTESQGKGPVREGGKIRRKKRK